MLEELLLEGPLLVFGPQLRKWWCDISSFTFLAKFLSWAKHGSNNPSNRCFWVTSFLQDRRFIAGHPKYVCWLVHPKEKKEREWRE